MKTVLIDIEKACTIIQEFYAILGPDLKQVTGDSDKIDMETDKVKDEVRKLENFNYDIFNHRHESRWKDLFQQFVHNTDGIDTAVLGLI
jgi:dynein heavy chain